MGLCLQSFVPPMLCERLTDPARLADREYIAEPKLDGQRAQLHVRRGRAVACFSQRGLDLLGAPRDGLVTRHRVADQLSGVRR
jgi:ATP-dependent DNA ligase